MQSEGHHVLVLKGRCREEETRVDPAYWATSKLGGLELVVSPLPEMLCPR